MNVLMAGSKFRAGADGKEVRRRRSAPAGHQCEGHIRRRLAEAATPTRRAMSVSRGDCSIVSMNALGCRAKSELDRRTGGGVHGEAPAWHFLGRHPVFSPAIRCQGSVMSVRSRRRGSRSASGAIRPWEHISGIRPRSLRAARSAGRMSFAGWASRSIRHRIVKESPSGTSGRSRWPRQLLRLRHGPERKTFLSDELPGRDSGRTFSVGAGKSARGCTRNRFGHCLPINAQFLAFSHGPHY